MARGKINKSQKIRDAFEKLGPKARPKEVIALLSQSKIKVSSAQVSNIKAKLGNGRSRKNGAVSLDDLHAAKKLADRLGGVQKAQHLLDMLAKLQ